MSTINTNPKALDDEIASGLSPEEAKAKMEKKKYRCGSCLRSVAYGGHCSTNPTGNPMLWDAAHKTFMRLNGHLYEELV
jgi:hypothetical protein